MPGRVVILTSVHPHDDIRIFHKEALTLVAAGWQVCLLNSEFAGEKQGVRFVRVAVASGRAGRVALSWLGYARAALAQKPQVCHLHDPELLPAGLWLKRRGIKVVYDAHEDLPKQIQGKPWVPKLLRGGVAGCAGAVEQLTASRFDLLICATAPIAKRFASCAKQVITLHNYPKLCEFAPCAEVQRERAVCYVGALTHSRGALEMARAANSAGVPLYLAGRFETPQLQQQVCAVAGVNYLGVLGREQVAALLARCCAGLVVLHPTPAYVESIPIKLLEYLAAGLPAIASDFSYWRALLGGIDCALFVNPMDENALARSILELADHPARARTLGENGRRGVESRFCWERECKKLRRAYEDLE